MADGRAPRCVTSVATRADGSNLATLHAQCFDRGWSEAEFTTLLEDGALVLIARAEGAPAAMIVIRAAAGEAEILTLATHPDFRGLGLAAGLLAEAIARLSVDGVERLVLEVADDNAPALALYLRAGFGQVGRRRAYYPRSTGAVDATVMAKALDLAPAP